jgi:hypothetical protein
MLLGVFFVDDVVVFRSHRARGLNRVISFAWIGEPAGMTPIQAIE